MAVKTQNITIKEYNIRKAPVLQPHTIQVVMGWMKKQDCVSKDFYSRAMLRGKKTQWGTNKSPKGSFYSKQWSYWGCSQCTDWVFWCGDMRLFLGTPKSKWSCEKSSPFPQKGPGPSKPTFNQPLWGNPQHMARGTGQPVMLPRTTGWDSKGGKLYYPFEVTKAGKM